MIGTNPQFIFVHIPKTAGNALQSVLSIYSKDTIVAGGDKDGLHRFGLYSAYGTVKHSTLAEYLSVLGSKLFWSKPRFTCIRNPWDRAISFYFSPHRGYQTWDRNKFIHMLDKLQPMTVFLKLPNNKNNTSPDHNFSFIMRYEKLNEDFSRLCDIFGLASRTLPVLNKGNRLPYIYYYDAELVQIVRNRFREDVELFGYEFNACQRDQV